MIFAMQYPRLTAAIGFAINVLLPQEFHDSMMASGIPPFRFAGTVGSSGRGFLRAIAATKNPSFQKIINRWNQSSAGLLARETGAAFEDFFEELMPGAAKHVRTFGRGSIDYVWRGFAVEIKSGRDVDVPQLAASSQYAKDRGLSLVYYFLKKPSQSEINKVKDAGGHVIWFYDF